jgi:hypothetical protein
MWMQTTMKDETEALGLSRSIRQPWRETRAQGRFGPVRSCQVRLIVVLCLRGSLAFF